MWLSVFIIKLVVDVRFLDTVVAWNGQFGSNFYLNKFTNEGSHQTLFWEKVKIPQTTQTLHTFSDILVFVSVFVFIVVPVFVIIFVFSIFNMISITFCNILRGFSNLWRFWASIFAIKYLTSWKATRQIMFSKMLTKSKESDRTPPYPIGKKYPLFPQISFDGSTCKDKDKDLLLFLPNIQLDKNTKRR